MAITCLDNVIGLTLRDCPCILDEKPGDGEEPPAPEIWEDINESLSGYYIDDMDYGIPLVYPANAKECGDDNIYDILQRARSEAINELLGDLTVSIYRENNQQFKNWAGQVGEIKTTGTAPMATTYLDDFVGVKLITECIKGASLVLRSVDLYLDRDWTGTIYVVDEHCNEITSFAGTATEDTVSKVTPPAPIDLPLYDSDGARQTYYIIYDRQDAIPMNIQLHCGCGGSKQRKAYNDFFSAVGVAMPTMCDDITKIGNNTLGMYINMSAGCKMENWICFEDALWMESGFAMVLARVIQLYAIKKVISYVTTSSRINRYTLLDRKELLHKVDVVMNEIGSRLAWLAQNLPEEAQDCYCEKAPFELERKSILV